MRSLHRKHITIVFLILLTLVLVLGFQNCGKNMQALREEVVFFSRSPGGVESLKPLGTFVVGFGSSIGDDYYLNKIYKHDTDGRVLTTKVLTTGYQALNFLAIDDVGSANNGAEDLIQDIITLEIKYNQSAQQKAVRLVVYSGADLEIIRSIPLPTVASSVVFPFQIYIVEDRNNDQKKDVMLLASRSTFGGAAAPVASNRSRFKIFSAKTFDVVQDEVELTADLTNTSIVFSYYGEFNVTGDSKKEYVFKYQYTNYGVTPPENTFKFWTYSVSGVQSEKDVSALPNLAYGNLSDLNNDGVNEVVYSTDLEGSIGTKVEGYTYQDLTPVLELEAPGMVGIYGNHAPVALMSFHQPPEKDLIFFREYMISSNQEEQNASILKTNGDVLVEDVRERVIQSVSDIVGKINLLPDYDGDGTEDFFIALKDGNCFGLPEKELSIVSGKTFEKLHIVSLRLDETACNYYVGYPERTLVLEDINVRQEYLNGDSSP